MVWSAASKKVAAVTHKHHGRGGIRGGAAAPAGVKPGQTAKGPTSHVKPKGGKPPVVAPAAPKFAKRFGR